MPTLYAVTEFLVCGAPLMNGGTCSRPATAGRSWRPYCVQHWRSERYPFISAAQEAELDDEYALWLESEFERITDA